MRSSACVLFFALALLSGCGDKWEDEDHTIVSSTKFVTSHPGLKPGESASVDIIEIARQPGGPSHYYTDVQSVYCDERVCKVDVVRLFFNELGDYQHLKMQRGVDLEKAEGEAFSGEDYEKLHMILRNRNSGLARTHIAEFYSHQGGESNIDAVSGATISLHTDDYVAGAALTCYTLWHWANGDIRAKIRAKTGDKKTIEELRDYVSDGDENYKVFALEQLVRREAFDPMTIAVIIAAADTSLRNHPDLVVDYAEWLPGDEYFISIMTLFESDNSELRLRILYSILGSSRAATPGYYDQLSQHIAAMTSYQAIDLLLNVFEEKDVSTPAIKKNVANLLHHDDFIVARRAFWFLQNQQMSESLQAQVDAFYDNHSQDL